MTQRDYAAVMDYFGELAGDRPGKPGHQDSARRADERSRALWALNLEEGEVAGAFGGRGEARKYADALLWKIHKTERSLATPRQIWAVIFTLRKRAKARRSETRARKALGARGAAGVPLSPPDGSERFPAFSRGV